MNSLFALTVVVSASVAFARPPAKVESPSSSAATKKFDASGPADQVLAQLESLYANLEYDQIAPIAESFVKREDINPKQRIRGYWLLGSAKAITGDPVDAEPYFYKLLTYEPSFDSPSGTAPKILAAFVKVKEQFKAVVRAEEEDRRKKIVGGLKLLDEPPTSGKGGKPIKFSFRLSDPLGQVAAVKVPYRRQGQPTFSSLALEHTEDGAWRGNIPGEITADPKDYTLEYYVETTDAKGPLLSIGSATSPKLIPVASGLVETKAFKPVHKAIFATSAVLTGISGGFLAVFGALFNTTQAQYKSMVNGMAVVAGSDLVALDRNGTSYAQWTNGLIISTSVLLAGTVVLGFLTRFNDEP